MIGQIPLVDKEYLLEKFQGKGGWTFARIPEIPQNRNTPFGWVRVRGTVDNFEIKNYNLQPMGNGNLFLPVKAEIRKAVNKREGDHVHITLFADNSSVSASLPALVVRVQDLCLCMVEVFRRLRKKLSIKTSIELKTRLVFSNGHLKFTEENKMDNEEISDIWLIFGLL